MRTSSAWKERKLNIAELRLDPVSAAASADFSGTVAGWFCPSQDSFDDS
jgi:hypothetical protein